MEAGSARGQPFATLFAPREGQHGFGVCQLTQIKSVWRYHAAKAHDPILVLTPPPRGCSGAEVISY